LLADVQVSLAELAERDPLLETRENQPIRQALDTRYGQLFKRIGI
jgi:hypothetical protein